MTSYAHHIAWTLGISAGEGREPEEVADFYGIDMRTFDGFRLDHWRDYDRGLREGRQKARKEP